MQPEARHRPLRLLRYILIAVAISASLFLAWLALSPNVYSPAPGVCVVAALAMAGAAGGLVAGRAWGAYVLSVGAFVLVIPLAFLALWMAFPWVYNPGPERFLFFLPVGLVLLIGVLGVKLGRSMRREERAG